MNFNFDLQRFATQTISDGETFTADGVLYTALDGDAQLNLDDDGKISGLASGKVTAVVVGAENSPKVTFDATDNAITFTASGDGKILLLTSSITPIEFIEGEFSFTGSQLVQSAGSALSLVTKRGDCEIRTTGGTASIQFAADRTTYTPNEGANLVLEYLDGTTLEIQAGSLTEIFNTDTEDALEVLSAGSIFKCNDDEFVFTLETAGTYNLNGIDVTTTADNAQVSLIAYNTVKFAEGAQINYTTSLSGNEFDVTVEGQGTVTRGDSAEVLCDATDSTLKISLGLENLIGESLLPSVFNISGGSFTTDINNEDGTKDIYITKGTALSFTRNGITFNAVAQDDIYGRVWLRNGSVLYLHSYEDETAFNATVTFGNKEIFSGVVTLNGAFSYNTATGALGPVDSDTYNVHDSSIQIALGKQVIKLTTNGDTFFAVLNADDSEKISLDFSNEKYSSMLVSIVDSGEEIFNSALKITGLITVDPATQEISLAKDTVLTLTQGDKDLKITALNEAGGELTFIDGGIRFAPNTDDGALELNFVDSGRKANLSITGAVILGEGNKISLEDGTQLNLDWNDGNKLQLNSRGSTGSVTLDNERGIKITSDDEKLDLELTMANGYSTKVSGLKGSLWYEAGKAVIEEGTKLTGTGTLGGNVVNVTLETVGGDANLDFSTTEGFIYGAGTGALKVTYALGTLESTFVVNKGSVLIGSNILKIAEGTDLSTDLKNFIPAMNFTTSEAGSYTVNGQTIKTTAANLALTATDDYMSFTTSSDVIEYEGMTFVGAGKVSLKADNVVLGAGVEAAGFGEGNSFVLAEAGNVTADAKIFELTELDTPIKIPMEFTITGAQDGFSFSRTLTKESEAYLDDALTEEKFENYSSSYIGKVFTERFISAGDSSYRLRMDATGLQEVIGISDGATLKGGGTITGGSSDEEPTLNYYNLVTDTEGSFTIGERNYNVSGDSNFAIRARFEVDSAPYASYFDSLSGTVSGDFTGKAFRINSYSGLKILGDSSVEIVTGENGLEIFNVSDKATLESYAGVSKIYTDGAGEFVFGAEDDYDYLKIVTDAAATLKFDETEYLTAINDIAIKFTIDPNSGKIVSVGAFDNEIFVNGAMNVTVETDAPEKVWAQLMDENLTLNDNEVFLMGDEDGIWIRDKEIVGLDEDAILQVSEAGAYTVNNTPLKVNADDYILSGGESFAYVLVTTDNTQVSGTEFDDYISNGGVNVTINAGAGNDSIENAGGSVIINAGAGNDSVLNIANNVSISGGIGDDSISNHASSVTIDAGDGNDYIGNVVDSTILSADLGNSINAGDGDDTIYSDHTYFPTIFGGAGNDSILVNRGSRTYIDSGEGNDTIIGRRGIHEGDWAMGGYATINGGNGDDYIETGYSDLASIAGGDGNDTISVLGKDATIDGGTGNDLIIMPDATKLTESGVDGAEEIIIVYNAGDGNDTIQGFTENATLSIAGGKYSSATSGDDLILTVGEDKITLQGAASLTPNIIGDEKSSTEEIFDSIAEEYNYGTPITDAEEVATLLESKELDGDMALLLENESVDFSKSSGSKNVTLSGGKNQDIKFNKEGDNIAVIDEDAVGKKNISLGGGGDVVVVGDTGAKVNVTASKGNDSIISSGENVSVKLSGGATEIFANDGKMKVDGYDAKTGAGFGTNYADVLEAFQNGDFDFEKGKLSINSAVVDLGTDSALINIFDASGNLQKVGYATDDDSLNASSEKADLILVGEKGSTMTGGKGDDSIFADDGAFVDAGAGKNYVYLNSAESDTTKIVMRSGRTTVENFSAGFEDTSDRIFVGVNDTVDFKFDGSELKFYNNNKLRGVISDIANGAAFVNLFVEDANGATKVAVAQENEVITVEDEIADLYVGKKSGVDFTAYEENLTINLGSEQQSIGAGEVLFSGINQITVGGGLNTLITSLANETLTGNADGVTEFVFGGGRDVIKDFNFDADKISVGAAVDNVILKDSGDVILQLGEDRLTLEDAQGKNFRINEFTAIVDKNIEFDGTANYFVATSRNASVTVNEEAEIWLDGSHGKTFVGDIKTLDATNSDGKNILAGNYADNTILGGKGDASLWGGNGGDDLLIGGSGKNLFFYGNGNGNDTIQGVNVGDVVYLGGVTLDNLAGTEFADGAIAMNFKDGGRLTVNNAENATFVLGGAENQPSYHVEGNDFVAGDRK